MIQLAVRTSAIAVAALLPLSAAAQTPRFHPVRGQDATVVSSTVSDVSADGSVVAGWVATFGNREAFRWTPSDGLAVIVPPDIALNFDSFANGVSSDGSTIVISVSDPEFGFIQLWTESAGTTFLPTPFDQYQSATSINGDGSAVVGMGNSVFPSDIFGAFFWSAATGPEVFADPGWITQEFSLRDINDDGTVIVGRGVSLSDNRGQAVRWTATDGVVGLGFAPGFEVGSTAEAVSAGGDFVVGRSFNSVFLGDSLGFLWTEASGMVGLGTLPGLPVVNPSGVSADGAVVVGRASETFLSDSSAFLWTPATGMLLLEDFLTASGVACLDGWQLTSAQAISDDGNTIIGNGLSPSGSFEGWVVYLDGGPPVTLGERYCDPAALNSSGGSAEIELVGTSCTSEADVELRATALPVGQLGVFLASLGVGEVVPFGSQGTLCLGGNIVRFQDDAFLANASGTARLAMDFDFLGVQLGETWNFQAWFRDSNPDPTSNLTDAVAVTFR